MRVIGGTAGGRRLKAPPGAGTRPTSDAVREALFNALASRVDVQGARVLDLFAGSGALGIEALSRGATEATFVESDSGAADIIEENLEITGLQGGRVVRSKVQPWLDRQAPTELWDIVLADPPYAYAGWSSLLGELEHHVVADGLAVLETGGDIDLPRHWRSVRTKRYGTTVVTLATPCKHPSAESG
jgi:16S rRNA (guanine966-N2)-methyltransferase